MISHSNQKKMSIQVLNDFCPLLNERKRKNALKLNIVYFLKKVGEIINFHNQRGQYSCRCVNQNDTSAEYHGDVARSR